MEVLERLTQYDWFVVASAIIVAMLVFKFLSDLFDWFIKKFGIETKAMRRRREEKDLLKATSELADKTAKNLDTLQKEYEKGEKEFRDSLSSHITESKEDRRILHDEQKELTASVGKLTTLLVDKQISDYRWEIINLADKISNGAVVSKECLKHAVATHTKYETIIEENGLTNGEVELSMEIINDEYRKIMKDGND